MGDVVASIVKRLVMAGALLRAIPRCIAGRIVGSKWLRGA
jgi:hypothetical protein